MKIANNVFYVGVNDYKLDLFEGQYPLPNGMAYNSYVIMDEKIAILDTVDHEFALEWLSNVEKVLAGKEPDYLVIHHMEPDHSSSLDKFLEKFPNTKIVGNAKVFQMINQFYPKLDITDKTIEVKEKDKLALGQSCLTFYFAAMVHWPEVMTSYDEFNKILFSADAFGKFGALDVNEEWSDEARRYYYGIIGKYGKQVQALLKKISELEINYICSLHGPVLSDNIDYYLNLYNKWSNGESEIDGVLIAYCSMYGNTKKACEILFNLLKEKNVKAEMYDLARTDVFKVIGKAFQYNRIVLASPTYNTEVLPFMTNFLNGLLMRNYQNRKVGIIENGSWALTAAKRIKETLSEVKDLTICEKVVSIKSSVSDTNLQDLEELAKELLM